MSLKFAILGLLDSAPMTGYELGQFFAASSRWVWSAPQSQIYPLLTRLEDAELIIGQDEIANGRLRRSFQITSVGMQELVDWASTAHKPAPTRDPLILQALSFDLLDSQSAKDLLQKIIKTTQQQVDDWRDHKDQLAAGETVVIQHRLRNLDDSASQRITSIKAAAFNGLVLEGEARLRWLNDMLQTIETCSIDS